jgi:hypothetical protein
VMVNRAHFLIVRFTSRKGMDIVRLCDNTDSGGGRTTAFIRSH